MSVIDELIYDRTQYDVDRVYELKLKIMRNGISSLTASELTEYSGGMRGAYNRGDLNRVGNAEVYIRDEFNGLPSELSAYLETHRTEVLNALRYAIEYYSIATPVLPDSLKEVSYSTPVSISLVKIDWTVSQYPGEVTNSGASTYAIGYYLANVNTLRNVLPLSNAPSTPASLNNLDYNKANDIERILFLINAAYEDYSDEKHNAIDEATEDAIVLHRHMEDSWIWSNEVYAGEY